MSVQNPPAKRARIASLALHFDAEVQEAKMLRYVTACRRHIDEAFAGDERHQQEQRLNAQRPELIKVMAYFVQVMKNLVIADTPLRGHHRDQLMPVRESLPDAWVHRLDNWYSHLEMLMRALPEGMAKPDLSYVMEGPDRRTDEVLNHLEDILLFMSGGAAFSRQKLEPFSREFAQAPQLHHSEKSMRMTALSHRLGHPKANMEELLDHKMEMEKVIEILTMLNKRSEVAHVRQAIYSLVRMNLEHLSNSLSGQLLMIFNPMPRQANDHRVFDMIYKQGPDQVEKLLAMMNSVLRSLESIYYTKQLLLIEEGEQD